MTARTPLLLTAVITVTALIAVVLAGCSGDPGPTQAGSATPTAHASQTVEATPTATPTVTTDPSQIADNVTSWYEYGGAVLIGRVTDAAVKVQTEHANDASVIDFEDLVTACRDARSFGSIPDQKTYISWTTAVRNLYDGANSVLDSGSEDLLFRSPDKQAQEFRGWEQFSKGIADLKAFHSHLRSSFGLAPEKDPWKDSGE
ncbi:hypothetical protein ACIHCQ_38305 [Streptomyces sp. NPDC052236]|uniref:hypothetical protein n=1 Tax=Streptomyces sp. NPDC052236 TaxID=3365686 RepID=UPI0037CF570E